MMCEKKIVLTGYIQVQNRYKKRGEDIEGCRDSRRRRNRRRRRKGRKNKKRRRKKKKQAPRYTLLYLTIFWRHSL